jgi:hypothetical protein
MSAKPSRATGRPLECGEPSPLWVFLSSATPGIKKKIQSGDGSPHSKAPPASFRSFAEDR